MEKIMEIDLNNREDLTEKYNNKNASKNLISYIIDEAIFIGKDDSISVIINNNCDLDGDCIEILKDGLKLEYNRTLKRKCLNNVRQIIYLIIGILFLFLSTIIKDDFIFKEIFIIIGWVPIWEVMEIELFTDIKEKRKRKIIKKLLNSNYIINEKRIDDK